MEAPKEATLADEVDYVIEGSVSLNYHFRSRSDDNDSDIYSYLSLDGGNPEKNDVTFHVYGRLNWDVDGDASKSRNPFFSLNDVDGNNVDLKVYEAYVDLQRVVDPSVVKRIRLGRQEIFAGYSYLLDGASVDFMPIESFADLAFSFYAGVPEYLYDTERESDWLLGMEARMHPFQKTFATVRYFHVNDENDYYSASSTIDNADDFAALNIRQRIGDDILLSGEWDTIDGNTRDIILRFDWTDPETDMALRGSYAYQDTTDTEYAAQYDLFVGQLLRSQAHHTITLDYSMLFSDHFGMDLGAAGRVLQRDDDEGPFNREYARGYFTLSSFRWPIEQMDLALTGEVWEAEGDSTLAVGGEVRLRPCECVKLAVGSFYSRYKYDLFVVDEREDATTFFLSGKWTITKSFLLNGRYEFETGDEGDFHALTLGITWRF